MKNHIFSVLFHIENLFERDSFKAVLAADNIGIRALDFQKRNGVLQGMGKSFRQLVFGNITKNMEFVGVHSIFIVSGDKDHERIREQPVNPAALLVMALVLPFELLCVAQENKKTVAARMERLSHALEGVMWTLLLYQMLVLRVLSGADLVTSRSCIWGMSSNMKIVIDGLRAAAENSVYIYRIREFLQMEPSIVSDEEGTVPKGVGGLSAEHVDFGYLPGQPVLKDVTFAVKPGQKIALVGYNGSGKTTLVKLLLRLYDPSAGRICYHGKDIRTYQVMAYRRSIGSVFQDFKIYAATLKENVLMDVEKGSREESYQVERALYEAHFTLEDDRLSYQIETPLTTEFEKDGVNLSGGEAQKVAIARTLYRQQDIIIMDEPSSALDPLAEYRLNRELNEIAKDKTVVFISHRLSTVRDADCIYMMENGRIVESGTHEELLAENGKYAAMWRIQAGLYRDVC